MGSLIIESVGLIMCVYSSLASTPLTEKSELEMNLETLSPPTPDEPGLFFLVRRSLQGTFRGLPFSFPV